MKHLKRSATTLNLILNAAFWLLLLRGAYAAIYHCVMLYRLFTDPTALSGQMGLTIDWLILEAEQGFGIALNTAVSMKLVQLGSAIAVTVIACLCIRSLKRILLPIEVGQPFREGAGKELHRLSRLCFALGVAENLGHLFAMLLIENGYDLEQLLQTGPITSVQLDVQARPAWFFVAAVVLILSMVFRQARSSRPLPTKRCKEVLPCPSSYAWTGSWPTGRCRSTSSPNGSAWPTSTSPS